MHLFLFLFVKTPDKRFNANLCGTNSEEVHNQAFKLLKMEQILMLKKEDLKSIFSEFLDEYLPKKEDTPEVKLITAEEVQKILGVDRSTLWRWSQKKYLVPIKVGGLVRYKMNEINEIMQGR